jgi:methyl-accepting chemotaxis protein
VKVNTVLNGALRPGVRALALLSYPRKLAVLAVLLAAPALFAAWAYTGTQDEQIDFSLQERVGVRYVQPVTELLGSLVVARHEAVSAAAAGRPVPALAVDDEVGAVAAVDRELGSELRTTELWNDLRAKIDALKSPPEDGRAVFEAYNEATAAAQALIVAAGDKSNLILDPDLDSFYVMDAIVTKYPAISDTLGKAGDLLTLHRGRAGVEERIELAVDNGIVRSAGTAVTGGFQTSFKNTEDVDLKQLRGALEQLDAQVQGATGVVEQAVKGNAADSQAMAAAAASAAAMNVKLSPHLDRLLETRLDGIRRSKHRVQLVLALGLLLALYAFGALYLLVTRSLRQIAAAAEGLAEGDVDQQLDVDSRDEVGQVATAFRSTISYLKDAAGAAERIADGDLTVDVQPRSERDALGTSFAVMTTKLRTLLGEVSNSASIVSSASLEMATTSEEAGRAVGEIAGAVGEVAVGAERQVRRVESAKQLTEDVTAAAGQSSRNARETTDAAGRARQVAEEGAHTVDRASEAMEAVRAASLGATEAIRGLGEKSEQITGIVDTITGIAEQTNLLALNAAIEAARAGEQGRGFAVVAEEVRKLAEESQQAAGSISALIREIQGETAKVVGVVEQGAEETSAGVETVERAREAFVRISESVDDVNDRVEHITTAIDQIASSSERMQEDMSEVAAVAEQSSASAQQVSASTQETSASTQQIAASAQQLARSAEELENLVGQFRLTAK